MKNHRKAILATTFCVVLAGAIIVVLAMSTNERITLLRLRYGPDWLNNFVIRTSIQRELDQLNRELQEQQQDQRPY